MDERSAAATNSECFLASQSLATTTPTTPATPARHVVLPPPSVPLWVCRVRRVDVFELAPPSSTPCASTHPSLLTSHAHAHTLTEQRTCYGWATFRMVRLKFSNHLPDSYSPTDATEGELHAFLTQPGSLDPKPPEEPGDDDAYLPFCSIFLMAKSNCAFVNYNSKGELLRAVQQFHGRRLRPNMRVRLVCRIRTKEKQAPTDVLPGCVVSHIAESTSSSQRPLVYSEPSGNVDVSIPTTSGSKRFFVLKSVTHVCRSSNFQSTCLTSLRLTYL